MSANSDKIVSIQTGPRLLWLLPLVALLLLLWQIPWISLIYRQVGIRAFLQAVSLNTSLAVNPRWPAFIEMNAETPAVAPWYLKQANSQLNTDRTLGVVALATNDLTEAQRRLLSRLEVAPDDVIAHFFLGETYFRLKNPQAAIEQWEVAGAKAPLMKLAQDLIARHVQAEALEALEAIMRLDAADAESRQLAAQIYVEQGNPEHALALYQEIISAAPEKDTGYALSGQVLFDEGQYEQAIMFFEQALQRSPQSPLWIVERLGRSHAALNQWPEAVTAYQQVIREDPTRQQVYVLLGEAQCQLGRPEEARTYYERAIALGDQSKRTRGAVEYITQSGDCPSK